jgi:hypothetical protein
MASFDRLNRETARRVVKFYERRGKLAALKASSAAAEDDPDLDAELQTAI